MQFIQGSSRHQTYFATLEGQVSSDNVVRLIDAFTDKLALTIIQRIDDINQFFLFYMQETFL